MMAAGFIRLEGDQYKSTAQFEGGKLLVNGKEIRCPWRRATMPVRKRRRWNRMAASKNLRHSECDH
jgi:hypothetical protein